MSYHSLNMMMFFLTLMTVGIIIASPIDYPTQNVGNLFVNVVLKSMNNNSPNNHRYRSGALLQAQKISANDDPPIVKISILLETDCIEESLCPQEICKMLITQDESNNLIIDDQSKECNNVENITKYNLIDTRSKREATEVDVKDPIIKEFKNVGSLEYYNEYKNAGKPFVTRMVNATKEDITDGTKYVIYFEIVEPTCMVEGSRRACFIDDFSPTRLCVINVEKKDKLTTTRSKSTTTCDTELTPSLMEL